MAQIRTFVAIEFSNGLKDEIDQIQQELKKQLGQLKWVGKNNFHLTLKFLGNVELKKVGMMAEGLVQAVQGIEPFSLGFARIGGFPKIHQPRVILLGINQGKEALIHLQKVVDEEMIKQGFQPEKFSYSPHLTLARALDNTDLSTIGQRLSQIKIQPTSTDLIRSIRIMKSDLRPQGPIYTCLKEIIF